MHKLDPAFPSFIIPGPNGNYLTSQDYQSGGLTTRDYIAIHCPLSFDEWDLKKIDCADILDIDVNQYDFKTDWVRVVAALRYRYADAMIAESSKS